jgi:GT2 family glycosyltransferase
MLNNDTVIAPDMIQKLLGHAETDPHAGILMPTVYYYGTEDDIWSGGGRYRRFPPAILFNDRRKRKLREEVRLIEYAPSCGLLIHRRAFEKAGLFDPGYFFLFDDWDFSERVRAHGLNIWFVRDASMWHKVSKTTKGPRSNLYWYTMGASITRFYRRHGRPVWLSLSIHLGYFILREFGWKWNWEFWPDFWKGVNEGLNKPLGGLPKFN